MVPKEQTTSTASEPQPGEPHTMTRKHRLAEHNKKCKRIVHYLRHGKFQAGLLNVMSSMPDIEQN